MVLANVQISRIKVIVLNTNAAVVLFYESKQPGEHNSWSAAEVPPHIHGYLLHSRCQLPRIELFAEPLITNSRCLHKFVILVSPTTSPTGRGLSLSRVAQFESRWMVLVFFRPAVAYVIACHPVQVCKRIAKCGSMTPNRTETHETQRQQSSHGEQPEFPAYPNQGQCHWQLEWDTYRKLDRDRNG